MLLFKKFVIFFVFFSIVFSLISGLYASEVRSNSEVLDDADSDFISTFSIVRDCERNGSNVSDLISSLNVCADYLSDAHVLYESGNVSGSAYYVDICFNILNDVKSDALVLREKSINDISLANGLTVFKSVASIIVIIIFGLVVWRIIRYQYLARADLNRGGSSGS